MYKGAKTRYMWYKILMKVYDLQCAAGHSFEGWFDDLKELENQIARGLLTCPVCGEETVKRIPSSFAIAKKAKVPEHEKAAHAVGKAMVRYLRDNFDDVGPQFAKEALKIHYGAEEPRNIRGVSTPNEEKMLQNEGVSFFKVGPVAPTTTGTTDSADEED